MAAPQHRTNPRQQLSRIERFRQIVVRSNLKTDDAIRVVALGCQHDDRDEELRRRSRQISKPFFPGSIRSSTIRSTAACFSVSASRRHFVRYGLETRSPAETSQPGSDLTVIIDNQDSGKASKANVSAGPILAKPRL